MIRIKAPYGDPQTTRISMIEKDGNETDITGQVRSYTVTSDASSLASVVLRMSPMCPHEILARLDAVILSDADLPGPRSENP